MTDTPTSTRRSIIWTLRIAAVVVVCWGVSGSVRNAFAQLSQHDWHVQPIWLVVSGGLYVLGLVPMGWFWQRTLAALNYPTPLAAALRAYFLGHLGKYVPGKAVSVILRVATVRKWVPPMRIALISTLMETLTMMASGAFLAAMMSIFVLHLDPVISLVAVGMACAAGAPTIPPVARLLASLGIARDKRQEEAAGESPATPRADLTANLQGINYSLLATGWLAGCVCWLFQALSLWATLRAIGVENVSPIGDFPVLIAAVAFAVVAGFLSQLPAGLGVRDALLMQLLIPVCGAANALVAAVLMRLVWLVSEVIVCGILYIGAARKRTPPSV